MTDTLPPNNLDAELALLAAILKSPNTMAVVEDLPPGDFYVHRHQNIWRAMRGLWSRGQPIDYATLATTLKRLGAYDQAGGLEYLSAIDLGGGLASSAEHYARMISDAATQRDYIGVAQSIAETMYRPGIDVGEAIEKIERMVATARPSDTRHDLLDPTSWANAMLDDYQARSSGQRAAALTGLGALDNLTLGLEAGALYLLMGTAGTGKTEIALQVGMHLAASGKVVLFASLEMTPPELAYRWARIKHGLSRNRLATGTLTAEEHEELAVVANEIAASQFWPTSPRAGYTTANLRADALQVQQQSGRVGLIVADYVQRFRDRMSPHSSREENVGMIAENLKSLAREFNCPVLAPVQPNREYVQRQNKRPVLSDLRESGRLEQEADVVLGLYRDERHVDDTSERGVAELHVLKNRSGVGVSEGFKKLSWNGSRYVDPASAPLPWRGHVAD